MQKIKFFLCFVWTILIGITAGFWLRSGVQVKDVPDLLNVWLGEYGFLRAGVTYILLYTFRTIILFPASLLTIASGLIFGPWLGITLTIIGENASANFAFVMARWLGRDFVGKESGLIRDWDVKIRTNALPSVVAMRLINLPFDPVNFACGLTSMRHRDYLIGTFIGIIPGLVSLVLLGGSVSANVENRILIFSSAVVIFILGLLIAKMLRKKQHSEKF